MDRTKGEDAGNSMAIFQKLLDDFEKDKRELEKEKSKEKKEEKAK